MGKLILIIAQSLFIKVLIRQDIIQYTVYIRTPHTTSEEAGHPSRDSFLPIKFFAQHANGGPRKFSRSESSGSNFWFSFGSVPRIELKSIPVL